MAAPPGSTAVEGALAAQAFKEADVSFPMKGNEQLLRVLYGVTLAQAIVENHPLATLAALAVTCSHCSGLVPPPPIEELTGIAESHLVTRGQAVRSSSLEDPVVLPKFGKIDLVPPGPVDIQETPNQAHWAQVHQNFQNLKTWVDQVNAAVEALGNASSKTRAEVTAAFKANSERAALEGRISVLKEECDVLWWLFAEHDSVTNRPWAQHSARELCMRVGRELAELLTFYEPCLEARSFLAKALSRTEAHDEAVAFADLIDAGSNEWCVAVAQDVRVLVRQTGSVTPLHTCLVERVDATARWKERIPEASSLRPEQQLSPVQWADQALREALLLSWLENRHGG